MLSIYIEQLYEYTQQVTFYCIWVVLVLTNVVIIFITGGHTILSGYYELTIE